jgi:iron uptake system EfeUOB component EfeO/EfeM
MTAMGDSRSTWRRALAGTAAAVALISATAATAAPLPHAMRSHGHHANPPIKLRRVRPALAKYRSYVAVLIDQLGPQVTTLQADIAVNDVSAAKQAWLTAHLTWLRIGEDNEQYGCFGALGRHIDGTAAGLPGGTSDSGFTGFHKLEIDLWSGHGLLTADVDASNLADYVQQLKKRPLAKALPPTAEGVEGWILRAHEVIEDAVRDSLSGNDDYGSGTDAASVMADVAATRKIVSLLTPLINSRAKHLAPRAQRQLHHLSVVADGTKRAGRWVSLHTLPRLQHERLNAAAGSVDETLAPVPDLLPIHEKPGVPTDAT